MTERRAGRTQKLGLDECLDVLSRHRLGRLAFTDRALPSISPMTYALVGSHVLLRIDPQDDLSHVDGQVVAFSVDELQPRATTGKTVVVTGTARLLRVPAELLQCEDAPSVDPRGPRLCLVQGTIQGRRVRTCG
jgi:nitroimidazol reductase NimA-like FMN-containing flavoprotein (pyridoxamine 5'-phosphate oxidase superfamily)